MRTLVLGGTGMLGCALVRELRRRGQPVCGPSRAQGDITDAARLTDWVERFRPQLIINCAAFTKVDDCETETAHADEVNGHALAHVVEAARRADARLIHLSTDYVFDGSGTEPYAVDAPTCPISAYGRSKLIGEGHVAAYEKGLVVRVSWLFGADGHNFVALMLHLMASGHRQLRVVDDQVGAPTYTPFLARALCDLATTDARGILHYQNREPVSWYGFTREIVRCWDPSVEVVPVTSDEFPRPASRPAYSVLDVTPCEQVLGRRVEPWSLGLAEYLSFRQGSMDR